MDCFCRCRFSSLHTVTSLLSLKVIRVTHLELPSSRNYLIRIQIKWSVLRASPQLLLALQRWVKPKRLILIFLLHPSVVQGLANHKQSLAPRRVFKGQRHINST